ncbi:hypothetical protein CYLTODRAFT_489649 [Cylindrobasidium torrendii FP15055 ss-10]|uniref:Uncharacterized protein n=1 Tax=Cylindrobasidium torrendii FP15055 ss-10 TaxID=1314674 RepID=A0A0D7BG61_9AGAR|nr:hypothetical protein CYLTODRAFT_489649 [Cylindrobasidium torrendii FP15055 ss-10]
MPLFSWIRRFFASIMSSSRQPDLDGHLIYASEPLEGPASRTLSMVEQFPSAPALLGHFVVADMQLWKKTKVPEHEFVVVRVVQVKDANSLPPFAKGSELASASILIERNVNNKPSTRKPIWDILRSRSVSSKASSASATSSLESADPEPIPDSHIHSMSAPDLPSAARTQQYPPVSMDDATPAPLAVDDGANGSIWGMLDSRPVIRASIASSEKLWAKPAYDSFDVYPRQSIKDIAGNKGAVCMATMDFTTASRPLLFEELAMMAKVTSESATKYSTPTTQCYWYAASIWGMVILHTGAKPEGIKNQFRLRVGALKGVLLPAHVFGVDDELKPAELLKTFVPEWDRYKAGLMRRAKMREEESDRKVEAIKKDAAEATQAIKKDAAEAINEAESRAQEAENARILAEKLAEERAKENAELKRMLAQRDGITSA